MLSLQIIYTALFFAITFYFEAFWTLLTNSSTAGSSGTTMMVLGMIPMVTEIGAKFCHISGLMPDALPESRNTCILTRIPCHLSSSTQLN